MQQSPYFVGFIYNWIRLNRVRTGFFRFLETKIVSVSVEARLLPTGFYSSQFNFNHVAAENRRRRRRLVVAGHSSLR